MCWTKDLVTNKINNFDLNIIYIVFMCSGKTQDLEEQQPSVEQELRRLMDKPGEDVKHTLQDVQDTT